jgi:copper transport protein
MIVRFSVIAMAALTVTGVAGLVMALFVDADIVGYVSTEWGRLMLLKIVLVAAAAVIGAHNHFRVLPALRASPTDEDVLRNTRTTVTIEAGLVMAAAVVTALLVAASTLD